MKNSYQFSVLTILLILVNSFYSQKKNTYSLQVFGVPLISDFQNINKDFVELNHEKFETKFFKQNLYEAGITYNVKNNKNIFGIGLSNRRINYKYYFNVKDSPFSQNLEINNNYIQERFFDLNIVGLRLKYGRQIRPKTSASLILEYNSVVVTNSNFWINKRSFTYSQEIFTSTQVISSTSVNVVEKRGYFKNYFAPELNFQTELLKNLSLYYGAKLKFWDSGHSTQIIIDGYFDLSKEVKPLYRASIKDRQISYYCGLVYQFNFKKKNKEIKS